MDTENFFTEERVDVFTTVRITDLQEPDRSDVLKILPGARSVILLGREVPAAAYLLPPKEKTRIMLGIAEGLDKTAFRLAKKLNTEHIPAVVIPLYLPVQIREGKVQGMVRLKNIAAAGNLGSVGKSSLLISPIFGPRLLMSGVVTGWISQDYQNGYREPQGTGEGVQPVCTGCERCIRGCPAGAIGSGRVDVFRCRTVRKWISPSFIPLVTWMLERRLFLRCAAPLAPWIARMATIPCSLCVTNCQKFDEEK